MKQDYANYLLEKTNRDYSAISQSFSRARNSFWKEMDFLIHDYLNEGDKVLDLGCGNGRLFPPLHAKGAEYTGVDSSPGLIIAARKNHPEGDFKIGSALNLPFPDNYFDKIYSVAVLHHIPSEDFRTKFLKEARRILKPQGLLIITVWNLWANAKIRKKIYKSIALKALAASKLDAKDIIMDWQGMKDCYFHCFTLKELEKNAVRAGFSKVKSGEIFVGKRKISNFYIIAQNRSD